MKKIRINFEYKIPEKKDSYSENKEDLIKKLVFEKKKMTEYLRDKQNEINVAIDDLVRGSNITEAEHFLAEVVGVHTDDKFRYIGSKNQQKINDIYMAYREVAKGINTYNIMKENEIFTEDEIQEVLNENIKKDIKKVNFEIKKHGFDLELKIDALLIDKDCYEKEIVDILTSIKSKVVLKVVG